MAAITVGILLVCALFSGGSSAPGGTPAEHTIKTIQSADGDIFDCVDMYKQPAFENPALKDHKLLMKPVGTIPEMEDMGGTEKLSAMAATDEICPDGTIPVRRSTQVEKKYIFRDYEYEMRQQRQGRKLTQTATNSCVQMAIKRLKRAAYHGVHAFLETFDMDTVEFDQQSAALVSVSVVGLIPDDMVIIRAGWMANQQLYNDSKPRLFFSFSQDGGKTTCINLGCKNFRLTSKTFIPGVTVPTNKQVGDAPRVGVEVKITKDSEHNWWLLKLGDYDYLGFWPRESFKTRVTEATNADIGGFVKGKFSWFCPKMGNGLSPDDHPTAAAAVSHIAYLDVNDVWKLLDNSETDDHSSFPGCYGLGKYDVGGRSFRYGGRGCMNENTIDLGNHASPGSIP